MKSYSIVEPRNEMIVQNGSDGSGKLTAIVTLLAVGVGLYFLSNGLPIVPVAARA